MKNFYLIILFVISISVFGQKKGIDTLFNADGSYKEIRYEDNYFGAGASKRIFRKSNNPYDINIPLYDTLYRTFRYVLRPEAVGTTVIHLNSNSLIARSRKPINTYSLTIGGRWGIFLEELPKVRTELTYREDSTLIHLSVDAIDNFMDISSRKDVYFFTNGGGTSENFDFYVRIDSLNSIELFFEKQILKSIKITKKENNTYNFFYYGFHSNFHLESRGKLFNSEFKMEEWEYYHENGNLKAVGSYVLFFKDPFENPEILKDNCWQYYDKNGNLEKYEFYKEGKLISKNKCKK